MANCKWKDMNLSEINWSEVDRTIDSEIKDEAFVYAACTDKIYLLKYSDEAVYKIDFQKLLELRVFNAWGELRFTRATIDHDFKIREKLDQEDIDRGSFFDQWQYMDINIHSINAASDTVESINGGKYNLPVKSKENLQIKVRNYVIYDDVDGRAKVSDWRLVGFGKGGR